MDYHCDICGYKILPGDMVIINGVHRHSPHSSICVSNLKARAEAAEKMAGKWLGLVTLRDNLIFELEAELAALRAQGDWRSVSEPPNEDGEYLTWHSIFGLYTCEWYANSWHNDFFTMPTHWRPLPPAPDGGEEGE